MYRRKLQIGDIFLILVNLLPLAGVLFYDWDPSQVFLIYCLETVIIGGFNVVKMLVVLIHKPREPYDTGHQKVNGIFFILFFIIHYGFFVFVQMSIFAGVSGLSGTDTFGALSFIGNIHSLLTDETKLVLLAFIGVYGLQVILEFILSGAYRRMPMNILMFQPYMRIVIQQFVVIIGSIFLQFGAGKIFMIIFVLIKLAFEVFVDFETMLERAVKKENTKHQDKVEDAP